MMLDGRVPARHTVVAPPLSARCRARRGLQACRRDGTAAVPAFFGNIVCCTDHGVHAPQGRRATNPRREPAKLTSHRPPLNLAPARNGLAAPAWPPLRGAQAGNKTNHQRHRAHSTRTSGNPKRKTLPHRRINAVPDRRSQRSNGLNGHRYNPPSGPDGFALCAASPAIAAPPTAAPRYRRSACCHTDRRAPGRTCTPRTRSGGCWMRYWTSPWPGRRHRCGHGCSTACSACSA